VLALTPPLLGFFYYNFRPKTKKTRIFLGFIIGAIVFGHFYQPSLNEILSFSGYLPFVGVLIVSGVSFVDDIKGLGYLIRLFTHVLGACCMIGAGFYIKFPYFEQTFPIVLSEYMLTAFFVTFIINACNFIDGLNGLLSGVFIIQLAFLGLNQFFFPTPALSFISLIVLALTPPLLGFFYYNFRPKTKKTRIFLGDCGSTFLGSMLAFLTLATQIHIDPYPHLISPHFISVLLPLSLLWFDVSVTLLKRIYYKRPLTEPARDYFFHLLNQAGWSHERVSTLYFIITFFFGCLSLYYATQQEQLWKVVLLIGIVLLIFSMFVTAKAGQRRIFNSAVKLLSKE